MKAKPGAKPPGGKPAVKTPAPAGAAKPPVKAAAKPAAGSGAADDLPFGLGEEAAAVAAIASRQPGKGRTLKVVCPMCETEGYVPPSAAGKDVKCANPKCMVPVFTAPVPEPEPVAPPPKKQSMNLVVLGLITAVVVGGIGAGAYFFAMQPSGDGVFVKPIDLTNIPRTPVATDPAVTPGPNDSGDSTTKQATPGTGTPTNTPAGPDHKAIVAAALEQCQQSSLVSDRSNRSKPYCRRYTAEAYAFAGNISGAKAQIDALRSVGQQLPFYQVTPWVEIYWQEQRNGNAQAATEALDKALAQAAQLPVRGSDQLEVATRLGQALVMAGRNDEARTLVSAHQTGDFEGEVSGIFQWLAADPAGTRLEWLFTHRPVVPRQSPQAAAVAAGTTLRGGSDAALAFAKSWNDRKTQTECLSAWAEALTWKTPQTASAAIETALASVPLADQAFIWSRAARIAAVGDQKAVARTLLDKAGAALDQFAPPENYVIPSTATLTRSRPTWDGQWETGVIAAAELAAARLEISGDQTAAGQTLERSLAYARGLGPAMSAVTPLVESAARLGASGLQNQLKTELELRTNDDARLAMGAYRRALTDLEAAAARRFQLQTTVLSRATALGLEGPVWTIVSRGLADEEPATKENFLDTDVAVWLAERFRTTQNTRDEKLLATARATAGLPEVSRPRSVVFREQMAAGQLAEALRTASDPSVRSSEREAWMLRAIVDQALSPAPLEATWKLVTPITDTALREQAVEWVSWMASRKGAAAEVWKHRAALSSATEIVVLGRGVVAGIHDQSLRTLPASTTTAVSNNAK